MEKANKDEWIFTEKNIRAVLAIGIFYFLFAGILSVHRNLVNNIAMDYPNLMADVLKEYAIYIPFVLLSLPFSKLLERTGMIKGIGIGMAIAAAGFILLIPTATTGNYALLITSILFTGAGFALVYMGLYTYLSLLSPFKYATSRISLADLFNSMGFILLPFVIKETVFDFHHATYDTTTSGLHQIAESTILPAAVIAGISLIVFILSRFVHFPATIECKSNINEAPPKPRYIQVFLLVTCAVGVQKLALDSMFWNAFDYDLNNIQTDIRYMLVASALGYCIGVTGVPRFLRKKKVLTYSSLAGLLLAGLLFVLPLPGKWVIICHAILGFTNALLLPVIWPLALYGLKGKQLLRMAAVIIMATAAGSEVFSSLYSTHAMELLLGLTRAYVILLPLYGFLFYYSQRNKRSLDALDQVAEK